MDFPELSCYLLPGHSKTPKQALTEAQQAEALGLGTVWISERLDAKEAVAISSAALAVTEQIHVASAATNVHTRHPMVTAGAANTLALLSDQRFALGVARGVGIRGQLWGLEPMTNAHLRDAADILRRLWKGEKVMYEGPMGKLPYLHLADWVDSDIPLVFVGFGRRSLAFAGEVFDAVHLHTFIGPEGIANARAAVNRGCEKAGRQPGAVKMHSVLATVLNPSREDWLRKVVGRMATYMQAPNYVELLAELNGWDPAPLFEFREHEVVKSIPGAIDALATLEQLEALEPLIPKHWLPLASGSAEQCAQRWIDELESGVDGICIHGSTAEEVAEVLPIYKRLRDERWGGSPWTGRQGGPV